MLILKRKNGEGLVLQCGDEVVRIKVNSRADVRIAIDAPKSVVVLREELYGEGENDERRK